MMVTFAPELQYARQVFKAMHAIIYGFKGLGFNCGCSDAPSIKGLNNFHYIFRQWVRMR